MPEGKPSLRKFNGSNKACPSGKTDAAWACLTLGTRQRVRRDLGFTEGCLSDQVRVGKEPFEDVRLSRIVELKSRYDGRISSL